MDFQVPCECGQTLAVTMTDAGSSKLCGCGRLVSIPSLSQLRQLSGLSAYEACPADEIQRMVADGTWELTKNCSHCGNHTDSIIYLHGVCEEAWRETPSILNDKSRVTVFVLRALLFFFLNRILFRISPRNPEAEEPREFGRDVHFTAPFRVCASCQRQAKSKRGARELAEAVPALQRLLKKYPDATFRLLKPHEFVGLNSRDSDLRKCA